MTIEAIARFYQAVQNDESLQLQLAGLPGENFPEALAELGAQLGHHFTAAEVSQLILAGDSGNELNEAALDGVVGGSISPDSSVMQFSNLYQGLKLESSNLSDPLLAPRGPPMMPSRF